MAYRGVKGSDPFVSKTSRNERFAQMSKQEQIIQQKKLEIQAKMQEQKAKEAVENMRKTNALLPNSVVDQASNSKKEEEKLTTSQTVNLFANDGSFLDQFKRIANNNKGVGDTESIYSLKSEEKKEEPNRENVYDKEQKRNNEGNRDSDNRRDRRRGDSRWGRNSDKRHSSSSSPSPTRRSTSQSPEARRSYNQSSSNGQRTQHSQQQFLPPNGNSSGVPSFASQPTIRLSGVPPPNMTNIVTNVPPPNLSNLPIPSKVSPSSYSATNNQSENPRMQISSTHSIHPSVATLSVQSVPPNTNVPPPHIHTGRTIPPNVQNLPPPPPPPPPPLPSISTSPLSSLSSTPLLSLSSCSSSSSSFTSTSSSATCSSSSSPLTSSTLHLAPLTSSSPALTTPLSLSPLPSTPSASLTSTASSPRQRMFSTTQQCGVPPPGPLQPTNLPPPNIPPPNLLSTMTQMPPNMMSIPGSQTITVSIRNASNVPNIPNVPPPNVPPPVMMSAPPPIRNVPSNINSVPPPNLNIPPPNVPPPPPPSLIQTAAPPPLMSTSYPLPNLPNPVSQVPMGPPNLQVPPPVRSMIDLRTSEQLEAEQLARIVADCGDEIEQEAREKNAQDPKLWFLHQKQSAAYLQYRGLVAKFRAERSMKGSKNSGAEPYCPEEALSDNEDNDHASIGKHAFTQETDKKRERELDDNCTYRSKEDNNKEERKRKRRSRWGDPDNKVAITEINTATTRKQQSGGLLQPGIAIPGQIGQPAVIIPSAKVQRAETKNPMLTKISRNDPALIQYARQTFGTLDLTEEQWKKAEDHYKINLLYQNLLRKREEVRRLEAQGKHKYEYDSDEETEGGTWEHKLRSAEMEATQMWAEELTAQAEGKHHIGDFLPPDELKKFMEQYNAVKQGKEPDLSDYKEYKLKEDNIGFQMLQKLGWSEGQGLGSEGNGRIEPINKATNRFDSAGLGSERPDGVSRDDDEFDAYRKRMMLAYRFRPNPLNNPRRPYY
ncbi:uncharacterized protein LOC100883663 isoform X2 [Megachile rotundata]|uniref:uncharacterized protein LOC100883663 isoform X2 n=1 Tax=Megachile rotundata TaxID=143995 RepID=UPI000614B314|nr:PREDICTED: arginine-glutamic acid dipeptide repeats protein-like isoform X2 [Megachile rotundata]